ncbi:MAG: CpaD family pilus assembly protein [Rhodobacteraceae bacterium]|nr:CpaD family pilus assembly protein [Paracoccaceae bacterium]
MSSTKLTARYGAIVCVGAAILGLAGCTSDGVIERYDQVHRIDVRSVPQVLETPVTPILAPRAVAEVAAFARAFAKDGQGPLSVLYPQEAGLNGLAASAAVIDALLAGGAPTARMLRGSYSVAVDGDRGVVLSYSSPTAFRPECPEHHEDSTRDHNNLTPRGFGCAFQNNLAAMIDRPMDLASPRPATATDTARREVVLGKYRKGELTEAEGGKRRVSTDSN